MNIRNEHYRDVVAHVFAAAPFIVDMGLELGQCGPGYCETGLDVSPRHLQQNGVIHAGVLTTMVDHTAGAAGTTLMAEDEYLLTVEFKVNLLRAVTGGRLHCRAEVLKSGRRIIVVESAVSEVSGEKNVLLAKGTFTMSVLKKDE